MSLLKTIDNAFWLCQFAIGLEEDGAYDEIGKSSIICTPSTSQSEHLSNCYAFNILSTWIHSINNGANMKLRPIDFSNIDMDLCYQALLKLVPILQKQMTIVFHDLCTALHQKVEGIVHGTNVDIDLLVYQIKKSMQCIELLIRCNALSLDDETMNPKPQSFVDLLHAVYDVPLDHSLRTAVLEDVYGAFICWLNDCCTVPNSTSMSHGLITVGCFSNRCRMATVCREELFQDLLFRGASAFVFQFGTDMEDHLDCLCSLTCKCHQIEPTKFHGLREQIISHYRQTLDYDDMLVAILPIAAPMVIFPYLRRAKQDMHCILMESEAVGVLEIAQIIVSFLFIGERDEYFHANEGRLDVKTMEFLNWIRVMGLPVKRGNGSYPTQSIVAREQFVRFHDVEFAKYITEKRHLLNLCVTDDTSYHNIPDWRYIDQLIGLHPPKLELFHNMIFEAIGCIIANSLDSPFDRIVTDWLKCIESLHHSRPRFDINTVSEEYGGSLLMFALELSQVMCTDNRGFEWSAGSIRLILYLLERGSKIDFEEIQYDVLLELCAVSAASEAVDVLSAILKQEKATPSVMMENCTAFNSFFEKASEAERTFGDIGKLVTVLGHYLERGCGKEEWLDEIINDTIANMNEWAIAANV